MAKLEDNLKKTEIELQKYKQTAESLEAVGATQSSKVKQVTVFVSFPISFFAMAILVFLKSYSVRGIMNKIIIYKVQTLTYMIN